MWCLSAFLPGLSVAFAGSAILAVIVASAGLVAGLAGVAAFRRHATTVNPTKPEASSAVVSDGIYRFSRNPMYLSLLTGLAGWALFLENAAALLVLPMFVAYMNRFQIKPEERALLEKFGSGYAEYMRSVRRWL